MDVKGEMYMSLFKKITAISAAAALVVGLCPMTGASASVAGIGTIGAAAASEEQTFDCPIGGSVTYYTQGKKSDSKNSGKNSQKKSDKDSAATGETDAAQTVTVGPDTLLNEQWALYNDGSFVLSSGENNFDVYDDPFGSPFGPGQWTDPYDYFFGRGFFRGFASKSNSLSQTNAVAGIDINLQGATELYNTKSDVKDVIVAVIDTGIDYSHEDLKDSIWINEDEIPGNGIDDDGNGFVDDVYGWNFYDNSNKVFTGSNDDHGTHCAGTIAASTNNSTGIASVTGGSHVKVMIIKALGGSSGTGETLSVVQAIKYAEANGASIVNLSFGCSYSDELLYNTMANSNMLFVVAAGNGTSYYGNGNDTDRTPCYPASYDLDNIISVANISYDGTLSSSSNYGAKSVDLGAPGSYIISTTPNNSYGYMTGTSMSAPFVTGAAALIYSYFGDITLRDVKDIILGSAKELDSLAGKTVTGGMLDVTAALTCDTSKLSHENFEGNKLSGSAPKISYTTAKRNNKLYITVTVTDDDRDLYGQYYAEGSLTASDFNYGASGTSFKLKNGSSATFVASDFGTYTFYVFDSEGHETVLVVDLSSDTTDGSSPDTVKTPDDTEKDTSSDKNKDKTGGTSSDDFYSTYPGWFFDWDNSDGSFGWYFGWDGNNGQNPGNSTPSNPYTDPYDYLNQLIRDLFSSWYY